MEPRWFTAAALADLRLPGLPETTRGMAKKAARERWPSRERKASGGGLEYPSTSLPPRAQAALLLRAGAPLSGGGAGPAEPAREDCSRPVGRRAATATDFNAAWEAFSRRPEGVRTEAERRFGICRAVALLIDGGAPKGRAMQAVAAETGVPFPTIRRWMGQVAGVERQFWQIALAPSWSGCQVTAACSPEAWDFFKADYLRLEQPRAAAVYDRLKRAGAEHGWTIPSLKTLLRRIHALPPGVLTLARKGAEALARSYPPQERDRSALKPMEAVNADGRRHDVMVRFPARAGEPEVIARPVMLALQDVYSGKILSWRIGRTESAELVRLAIADMVRAHGIPDCAVLDNGRGFASKWITGGQATRNRFKVKQDDPAGVLTQLGCEVHWATPYHGQAKPIERAFADLAEYIDKHPALSGAYTGRNTVEKPENYGSRAVPLDVFAAVVEAEIAAHNAREGRTAPVCAGRSFEQVFQEGLKGALVRRANPGQVAQLLLAAERVSVNRTDASVRLYGNRYWTDAAALARHAGKPAIARFDPQDLTQPLHLYQLDGRFIATLPIFERTGFFDQEAAQSFSRERNARNRHIKGQMRAELRMDALAAAALLPASKPSPPARPAAPPKTIRPVFGTGATPDRVTATAAPARMSREERERRLAEHVAQVAPHLMPRRSAAEAEEER